MKLAHILVAVAVGIATITSWATGTSAEAATAQSVSNLAAKGHSIIRSVYRVVCPSGFGTGFFHKSGKILTAYHVVQNCPNPMAQGFDGHVISLVVQAADEGLDIALLSPMMPVDAPALPIENDDHLEVGTQVATWGFPAGYPGEIPLLSVGYLSGQIVFQNQQGSNVDQWVVNAAFNSGNSGGPLIDIDTGAVIGIVDSKLAPISPQAASAIAALEANPSGLIYSGMGPDGKPINASEAQVVAIVLDELRKQTQLVIGMAIRAQDIRSFLMAQKIDP
ncbi:serine protease [Rhizobium sp. NXC24]|uniref:S1 family peptidase n=1 Tax=Rhizobium sp. NXC24 TaxID=2048897 RepID=UPI000CDF3528|nr:serine protease [Rhizobium sp. NXC24]AVA20664.1 peptidase PDZ domain-containing protein [Rhizobium sp. NXC24]